MLKEAIANEFSRYSYVLESDAMTQKEKERYLQVRDGEAGEEIYAGRGRWKLNAKKLWNRQSVGTIRRNWNTTDIRNQLFPQGVHGKKINNPIAKRKTNKQNIVPIGLILFRKLTRRRGGTPCGGIYSGIYL